MKQSRTSLTACGTIGALAASLLVATATAVPLTPTAQVVRFPVSLEPQPPVVRLNNLCATALGLRDDAAARRRCAAAMASLRRLGPQDVGRLESDARAGVASNAAVMHHLLGEPERARALIAEAARLSPGARFVRQNQMLILGDMPARLAAQ
jgi:hypothetical protein